MKFFILITFIYSIFIPAFADGNKKYEKEDFNKIKLMKIEYLNKRINCVQASNNFKELKQCWSKNK